MPLLPILQTNPEQVYSLNIQQIVSLCGNGKLLDTSECSVELRKYLMEAPSELLFNYIDSCLDKGGFDRSGIVLQDLVNELGRRLDYSVENGLYQGKKNAIGYDGIWRSPSGSTLVIEVKTTDAYRINLDTLARYRENLISSSNISRSSSILIVVGREDTGDLEAQVRGSKHAWDIRLISVDGLANLVKIKEKTEDDTAEKIRGLLVPFEYTKLDGIIDIAFTAIKDASVRDENALIEESSVEDKTKFLSESSVATDKIAKGYTPTAILESLRQNIILSIGKRENTTLIRRTAALYWNIDRSIRIACTLSRRYESGHYWYGYHKKWHNFLSESKIGYYVLGCVGQTQAYAIPFEWISQFLKYLSKSENDGDHFFHVNISETDDGSAFLLMPRIGKRESLRNFIINLPD